MGARGRRNLKRKRTSKEATSTASASASASALSVGADHADDLMKRNSRKDQSPSTKPTMEEAEAQPAGAGKKTKQEKRKRVVRYRLPEKLIHIMIVHSHSVHEIPDEELARCSEEVRASYAKIKARSEKWMADDQALIDQHLINGYAESVWEVTDDEDDGDDTDEEIVDIIN